MGDTIKINKNSGMLDYFSVIVIGDNPDSEIEKYDSMRDVSKPYIIYKYSDIHKIRLERIKFYSEFMKNTKDLNIINGIKKQLNSLNSMSDIEYYSQLGELHSYDLDKNIISTENPFGKWITCDKGGRIFSNYLKDFNDNGINCAKECDIDWSLIHLREDKVNIYNRTWDLCVNKINPETDKDKEILKNMRKYDSYFKNFLNKDEYVKVSSSFWSYAVIDNNKMWFDMENVDEFDWIINFYDKFIKDLDPNTLITIYECTK